MWGLPFPYASPFAKSIPCSSICSYPPPSHVRFSTACFSPLPSPDRVLCAPGPAIAEYLSLSQLFSSHRQAYLWSFDCSFRITVHTLCPRCIALSFIYPRGVSRFEQIAPGEGLFSLCHESSRSKPCSIFPLHTIAFLLLSSGTFRCWESTALRSLCDPRCSSGRHPRDLSEQKAREVCP